MNIEELQDNFEILDNWEDKYRYIMELGENLPKLEESFYAPEWKISGCQSQVWLVPEVFSIDTNKFIRFHGDSDAAIVKGLMAIVLIIFSEKPPREIVSIDISEIFDTLGLHEYLSPSRRNGLMAMVEKIKFYAGGLV